MKDDDQTLIDALRGGGHDDVADALDRKLRPVDEPAQQPAPTADEQLLADMKSALDDPWSPSPLFGGPDA